MLATEQYSHLQELATATADGYFPNVIRENAARRQELLAHATQCVRPATQHLLGRFNPCQIQNLPSGSFLQGSSVVRPQVYTPDKTASFTSH